MNRLIGLVGLVKLIASIVIFQIPSVMGAEPEITGRQREAFNQIKALFHEQCAMCHGYDGVPMMPGVPNFAKGERLEKSNEELLVILREGTDLMPPWKDVLSNEEQYRLLHFVRGVAGDKVFNERCNKCHGSIVPPLASSLPRAREDLLEFEGDLTICSGHDIEKSMSRKEIVDVVMYLRTLKNFQE